MSRRKREKKQQDSQPPIESTLQRESFRKTVRIIPRNRTQEEYLDYLMDPQKMIVIATGPAGSGKAQPLESLIRQPNGWKKMGNLTIGDIVSTPDGKNAAVTGIFPQGSKDVYEISFRDGRSAECCGEHLWEVFHNGLKKIMTTVQIINHMMSHTKPLRVRMPEPELKQDIDLPLDPYLLGAILGDGSIRRKGCILFTSADKEMIQKVNSIAAKYGGSFTQSPSRKAYDYLFTQFAPASSTPKNVFQSDLKNILFNLDLFGKKSEEKFIPEIYLESSFSQKIQLLQGLMDTDGWADKNGNRAEFYTSSPILCNQVVYLVRSIGGSAIVKERVKSYTYKGEKRFGRPSFSIGINLQKKTNLFSLTRKKSHLKDNDQYSNGRISIKSIRYVGKKECQCIMIDHPDHLYITDNFVVTHNTELAMSAGIKALQEKRVERLILTRPVISASGEDALGALPGDLNEKMDPYTRPLMDVLYKYYTNKEIMTLMSNRVIEISPLSFMRGRNFSKCFVVMDEAQNSTISTMKMVLTRICDGTKVVVTGDNAQSDRKDAHNGLLHLKGLIHQFGESRHISSVEFGYRDVQRHPVVSEILKLYGEDGD